MSFKRPHPIVRMLRRARQARGLTTAKLASKASVASSRIRDLECGRTPAPILTLIASLGHAMNMSLGWRHKQRKGPRRAFDRATRDACAEAMCHGCAAGMAMERRSGLWVHVDRINPNVSLVCEAGKIFNEIREELI